MLLHRPSERSRLKRVQRNSNFDPLVSLYQHRCPIRESDQRLIEVEVQQIFPTIATDFDDHSITLFNAELPGLRAHRDEATVVLR